MEAAEFLRKLNDELIDDDRDTVTLLCESQANLLRTSNQGFTVEVSRRALHLLRRGRRFQELLVLSGAVLHWFDDPELKRQHGQALIECGHLLAATQWLSQCEIEFRGKNEKEWGEVVGLLGRAWKQSFTDRRRAEDLNTALIWYDFLYSKDKNALWHGINVVCLSAVAEQEGITLEAPLDYRAIARDILTAIRYKAPEARTYWDEATIAEALVALDRPADAIRFVKRFCSHPEVGSFAINSLLSQFDHLWQLDEKDGDYLQIIDILRSSLMKQKGGEIIAPVESLNKIALNYEKCFTDSGPLLRTWFLQLIDCSNFVGRIWLKSLKGYGTGFLIDDGGDIFEAWRGFQIFVTCNHVISDEFNEEGSLFSDEATITFDTLEAPGSTNPLRHTVKRILWESPRTELDVTILQLARREERIHERGRCRTQLDILKNHARMPRAKEDRLYIVGHPKGGEMSFSFQDNQFIEGDRRRIQYITPTEPGSSGSPVFDQNLNVVAMHHAGSDRMKSLADPRKTRKANQGIPMPAIIEARHVAASSDSRYSAAS
ncbi:MAG: serine protease [Verrucomicrobiales bacterium]|nr:serine protease [Verrucomicrobiales bacterium]